MGEINRSSLLQLKFEGELAPGNPKRRKRIKHQSGAIKSPIIKSKISLKEQSGFEDAVLRKEISNSIFVKAGKVVQIPDEKRGYGTTLVQLKEYVILFKRPAKNYAARYAHYSRFDVPAVKHYNGLELKWPIEAGTCIATLPKDRERTPRELIPEVIQKIRGQLPTPTLLKNLSREVSLRRVG
jgi:hypothetical protein